MVDWEKEFIEFLAKEGVLFQFFTNERKTNNSYTVKELLQNTTLRRHIIDKSLWYAGTTEGFAFWNNVSLQWYQKTRELEQT